ncbi:NADPH-dependent F420 reductase [Microbacterium terrisoli]|jgi:predicted dinucleotide-binding enzyme|uniref:NADPH-dependent F420 reductase n=1 Tax=Microbacterium terrisoli TaxID=3242192 RepID=UPI00280587BC|nr:NAD(P)-binding domain-containing protein [Microbacterium protaetiae]
MTSISIIGTGKMGSAIADVASRAHAHIQLLKRKAGVGATIERDDVEYAVMGDELTGELVVIATPYAAIPDVLARYGDRLAGKVVIDISNPIEFVTFDGLTVPAHSSAAAEIAEAVPNAAVVKAFNINFAETLTTGINGGMHTTVIVAGDDADAKIAVMDLVEAAGMRAVDAGPLSRARELEAMGFLQITLAALAKTRWESGFALMT